MALDRDLSSIQQARDLVEAAHRAQSVLATFSQEKIDSIVQTMAATALAHSERLAEMAVQETGFGIASDKVIKNTFAGKNVHEFFRSLRTVGVIRETPTLIEVADPRGVVCAIIPSTNPTSTAIFKALISIKSRNGVVMSPHPSAAGCIAETTRLMREAAEAAGLPPGAIGCLSIATLGGTEALMKHEKTAVILATGGTGLVRAAYSSGKPAFGVGPGNVPVLIERSADIPKAVADILAGKTFDNGTVCASEQAVVVEQHSDAEVRAQFQAQGGYFLGKEDAEKLAKVVVLPSRGLNAKIVGKSVKKIAEMAGISVPEGTRSLMVQLEGVGRDYPLSLEKLSPILAYYVVPDFKTGVERCVQILRYGGTGHSVGIHSQDRDKIREFGMRQPASRILVNTPTTHGAIGFSTELSPSMTLGCGSWGGNVTSDNISPLHLMDVKRIAFETFPVTRPTVKAPPPVKSSVVAAPVISVGQSAPRAVVHQVIPSATPALKTGTGSIDRNAIAALVDQFLSERKAKGPAPSKKVEPTPPPVAPPQPVAQPAPAAVPAPEPVAEKAVEFVCEDDVRRAMVAGRKILTDKKTIITPAARDLGREQNVFTGYADK
ncbi:MAG: aldehyde dehydrogenase family protein [Blastocatellia bacterium]|nr:aldehyde dehydrogenase family protein [Blastocatellia bacterium]